MTKNDKHNKLKCVKCFVNTLRQYIFVSIGVTTFINYYILIFQHLEEIDEHIANWISNGIMYKRSVIRHAQK